MGFPQTAPKSSITSLRPRTAQKFKKPLTIFAPRKTPIRPSLSRKTRPIFRQISKYIKMVFIILLMCGIFGGLAYFVGYSPYLKVQRVEVLGAQKFVSQKDLTEVVSQTFVGSNIFFVDTQKMQNTILQTFHGAKDVLVERKFFNTIQVTIWERLPIALVHNYNSTDYYMVDSDGYILGLIDATDSNLPKVVYEGELQTGIFINKTMIPAYLEIYEALTEKNLNSTSMSFYPHYVQIYLDDGVQLFLGEDKKKKLSVYTIADLLKQLKVEGRNVKKIDLRYDKVIVEY